MFAWLLYVDALGADSLLQMENPVKPPTNENEELQARLRVGAQARQIRALIFPPDEPPDEG